MSSCNLCPVCAKQNLVSKLKLFQISFEKAVLLCSKENCLGDFSEFKLVDRKIDELKKPRSKWKKKQASLKLPGVPANMHDNCVSENTRNTSAVINCDQISQVQCSQSALNQSNIQRLDQDVVPEIMTSNTDHEILSMSFLDDKDFWETFDMTPQNDSEEALILDMLCKEPVNRVPDNKTILHNLSSEINTNASIMTDFPSNNSDYIHDPISRKDALNSKDSSIMLFSPDADAATTQFDFSNLIWDSSNLPFVNPSYGEATVTEDPICLNQASCDIQNGKDHMEPCIAPTYNIQHGSGSTSSLVKTSSSYSSILKKPNSRKGVTKYVKFPLSSELCSENTTISQSIQTDFLTNSNNQIINENQRKQVLNRESGLKRQRRTHSRKPSSTSQVVVSQSFALQRFLQTDALNDRVESSQRLNNESEHIHSDIESLLRTDGLNNIKCLRIQPELPLRNCKRQKCKRLNGETVDIIHRKQKLLSHSNINCKRKNSPLKKQTLMQTTVHTISPLNSDQSNASDGDASVVSRSPLVASTVTNSCISKKTISSKPPKHVFTPSTSFKTFPDKFLNHLTPENSEQQRQKHEMLSSLIQGSDMFEDMR